MAQFLYARQCYWGIDTSCYKASWHLLCYYTASRIRVAFAGKKGQYEVLVQGGVIDDLGRLLVESYGVPKQYIEVLDKTRR